MMGGIHLIEEFPEIVRCVPGTHTVWDGIPDTIKVETILSCMVLFMYCKALSYIIYYIEY